MTENTQTTAQRIQDMLDMNFNFYPGPPGVTAKTIAAEIDALTAGRDGFRDAYAAQGAILAAARYEVGRLTRMRDFERDAAGAMADQYSILAEERNDLKAEAERLRPAAEAWETAEVANAANANRMSLIMDAAAYLSAKADWVVAQEKADAARARAAKERKP